MTQELVLLRSNPTRGGICKVQGCDIKRRRHGFCERHSWEFARGARLISGEEAPKKPKICYNRDFGCLICNRRGKITKGFCPTHYNQFRKGLIDFYGRPTGRRRRIAKYIAGEHFCKISSCNRIPRGRGFCNRHLEARQKGFYDEDGNRLIPTIYKNAGKKCKLCEKPAHCKLYCTTHYSRLQRGRLET